MSDTSLHKLTFSNSLADFLSESYGLKKRRFNLRLNKKLGVGEESETGIYAIVSTKGVILRAALIKDIAELYRDSSREIYSASLRVISSAAELELLKL